MTEESKNNQNDQPTEEQQPSDKTKSELRDISKEELKQILEEHEKWLESDGKEGKRAYLKDANLQGVKLIGANLQRVILSGANLQKAQLIRANLQRASLNGANLRKALLGEAKLQKANLENSNFQKANLFRCNLEKSYIRGADLRKALLGETNLQGATLYEAYLKKTDLSNTNMQNTALDGVKGLPEANLQYANMEGSRGLLGNEFAQADVTGTELPDDIKEFKALETVEKTSQNARKIFFAMLLGCVYSWLTIATTTDVGLLTNNASSPLPIIGTEIPIAWFYITAPLVLICLYFYFHLYLDNLWGALASLPAIFPDGKRLDERSYPWLLNTLVRRHFKRLKSRPLIARMKEWITIFLAWMVVPITMIAFWIRFIPRHDLLGTSFLIGLIVLSLAFAIIFYRLCALTLQGKKKVDFRFLKFWADKRFYYGVSVAVVAFLLSLLSYGAIDGIKLKFPMLSFRMNFYKISESVPWAFKKFGYDVFADFREKDVSEKPANYWEISERERLYSVKGARLSNRNLKNADLNSAFLVKADLRGANLQNASLVYAKLQDADLRGADLQNADLRGVDLQNANLLSVDLQNAFIGVSDPERVFRLYSKFSTYYYKGLPPSIETVLLNAELQEVAVSAIAILRNADLRLANLQNADLREADLQNANLLGADLKGTKNLTIEQLSKVKTLYNAKLDPELMEQVKKLCPHLLEEPKKEKDKTS